MSDLEVIDDTPTEPGALERIADEMEVVPYQRPPIFPSADEFGFIMHMAEVLSRGNLVPAACRNKPADVAIVLLGARDLGIPLTQAFTKLHVIDGKLSISAELMVALALQGGHRVWCEELNGESATACAQRRGSDYVARFTFTIDDATNAGLIGKDNWKHYPKAMLWARAVSAVVRMHLPDVTAGITYTPEEMGDAEHFTAHPASALDPTIKEEFAGRANALPEEKRIELKAAFRTWGLNPISRLTVEEEPTLRALLEKAEAIDVPSEPSGAAAPPGRGDIPETPVAAVSDAPGTFSGSFLPGAATGEVRPVEPTPDIGSIQHEPDLEGPSVFNGDTGHCAGCGAPIWYASSEREGGPAWRHAELTDDDPCPLDEDEGEGLQPAGPEIDVDALYAATHPSVDPKVRRLQIEVDVSKMTQTKLLQALNDAGLSIAGPPKELKLRLVEYRLSPLDG